MSPNHRRALEKLQGKEVSLDDLPDDREAGDWTVIAEQTGLEPLELVALKNHKQQQHARKPELQQREEVWYQVNGIIKRNKHVAGVRFKLISLPECLYQMHLKYNKQKGK